MKQLIFIPIFSILFFSCSKIEKPGADRSGRPPLQDLVQYVKPLMGTYSTFEFSHGNIYPAIGRPWGMNTWTAQTGEMGSGWIYQYQKDSINGFRQTHQPSPWMNDYGTFSIMPLTGDLKVSMKGRASSFSHETEIASPEYYRVFLKDHNAMTELTPTDRAAIFKFTFPGTENSFIILDYFNKGGHVEIKPKENRIIGYTRYNSGGVPENFANYFILEFNTSFEDYGTWSGQMINSMNDHVLDKDEEGGAYVRFNTRGNNTIEVRVASSFISHEQAERNLNNEVKGKTFKEVREEGYASWNEQLNRILIEGATDEQKKTFYSTLYRSLLFPRIFYEFDAAGEMVHYSPYDGEIHPGYMYADNGFWDTFRAVFPFFTLLYPEKNATMMQWLVNAYEQGGWLPIWPSPGYRRVMIGNHSASLFADAIVKGITGFDVHTAFKGMLQDAMKQPPSFAPGRDGLDYYNEMGYVPYPEIREATAKTLEHAYDDFCIMQVAEYLGEDSIAAVYAGKSYNYKNVFDPESLLMRGRRKDGTFVREISPIAWGGPFTEGNAWHYTWSVFHDPQALIDLMGGKDIFVAMMDSVFSQPPDFETGTYPFEIHEITEMVAAGMGQYAHGNQPIQHMIYLYNYAGESSKSQYWIREVLNRLYKPEPKGYMGDEDNGQTSAWYVFSSMGFYPVCPGVPQYVFGAPLFEKITLRLPDEKILTIEAPGNSDENRYIKSVYLNGEKYHKPWISHEDLINGGELRFEMTDQPAGAFHYSEEDLPYSMSLHKD